MEDSSSNTKALFRCRGMTRAAKARGIADLKDVYERVKSGDIPISPDSYYYVSEMSKMGRAFDEFIESKANQYSTLKKKQLDKGFVQKDKHNTLKGNVNIADYFKHFFENDPISVNHNGVTKIIVKDDDGDDEEGDQTIDDFIAYSSSPYPAKIIDSLSYITNKDNNVYLKYQMPTALFHKDAAAAGTVSYGPSLGTNFKSDGKIDNELVIPNSEDAKNLTEVALKTPKRRTRLSLGFRSSPDVELLNTRFSFPNFLLGKMLHKRDNISESEVVYRPYSTQSADGNHLEFWVKSYDSGFYFPYDKRKYFLPVQDEHEWQMVERADGVIMYYHTKRGMQANFPPGSYMIWDRRESFDNVIFPTENHEKIKTAIMDDLMGNLGVNSLADLNSKKIQRRIGLVAYMTNLKCIFEEDNLYAERVEDDDDEVEEEEEEGGGGGSNKKKKSKRTNIKYMKRTKRTKRMKRMKRMNMKYMKKSKKNHHK